MKASGSVNKYMGQPIARQFGKSTYEGWLLDKCLIAPVIDRLVVRVTCYGSNQ